MRKIPIDTDPGQDDAVALPLAPASPEKLDVAGVMRDIDADHFLALLVERSAKLGG